MYQSLSQVSFPFNSNEVLFIDVETEAQGWPIPQGHSVDNFTSQALNLS